MTRRFASAALAAALVATALASGGNSTRAQDVRILRAKGGQDFVCFGLALTRDVVVAPSACNGASYQVAVEDKHFALKDIKDKFFTVNSQEFCAFFLADGELLPETAVVTDLPENAAYEGKVVATLHQREQNNEKELTLIASCSSDQTDTTCSTSAQVFTASVPGKCILYHAEHFYRDDDESTIHGIWVPRNGLEVAGSCNEAPFDVFLLNKVSAQLIEGKIKSLIAAIEDDIGNGGGSGGGGDDDDDGGSTGDDDDNNGGDENDDDDDDDGPSPGNNDNDRDQDSQQNSNVGSTAAVVIGVAAGCVALMLATGALFVLVRRKPGSSDLHDKYQSASVPVAVVVSNPLSEAQPVSRAFAGSEDDGDDQLVAIVKPDIQR